MQMDAIITNLCPVHMIYVLSVLFSPKKLNFLIHLPYYDERDAYPNVMGNGQEKIFLPLLHHPFNGNICE